MQFLFTFMTILAILGAVGGGALVAIRLHAAYNYNALDQLMHAQRGVVATFPIKIPGLVFIVSVVFLLTKMLN